MNDYICYYAMAGLAYAILMEYQYRTSGEVDYSDCWWFGELAGALIEAAYNTAFWPKLIIDDMIEVYLNGQDPNDED